MKYFLRLNGNRAFQVEVEHTEKLEENQTMILDEAIFPPGTFEEATKIVKAELLDENEELWAMRRIPEAHAPTGYPSIQYEFNWRLTICKSECSECEKRGATLTCPGCGAPLCEECAGWNNYCRICE